MKDFFNTQDQKQKIEYLAKFSKDLNFYLPQLLLFNKNCAYALANLSKKKLAKEILLNCKQKYENLLQEFILCDDAKIRKYAYIICGNCPTEKLDLLLIKQIQKEQTYFTLPSLMLSLVGKNCQLLLERVQKEKGQIADKIYREILQNYDLKTPKSFNRCASLNFDELPAIICTQKSYEDTLIKRLSAYKKQKLKCGIKLLNVSFNDYQILSKRRDIYSISLVLAENSQLELCLQDGLKTLSQILPTGNFAYRISCKDKPINDKILSCVKTLNFTNLSNSPTNYSIGIEVVLDSKIMLLATLEDCKQKFAYRQEFLPASINPVTANIIANICAEYSPNPKLVADVFCGTATMLIERKNVNPLIEIIGSDVSKIAIDKAKINLKNAQLNAKLIKCDVANFKEKNLDEIVSNLPYGLRVGSHEDNEQIYKDLIRVCNSCLKVGGFAFLYTADKKLLKTLIKKSSLTLKQEIPFISGGLYCTLFVAQKIK